jgi:hypothetical protein
MERAAVLSEDEEKIMQSRHLQQIALSLAVTACLGGVAQAQPAARVENFKSSKQPLRIFTKR